MRQPRDVLQRALARFSPKAFPYASFSLALAIGLIGAIVFLEYRLPLPWMLGPMLACTLASLVRAPIVGPSIVRPPMMVVVGVLLGAGFSPAILDGIGVWLPTLAGLVLFVAVSGLSCVTYFRTVGGLDLPTAYFAGMPGGLVEMVLVGETKGGDPRTIALIHSMRILLIVFSLPLVIWIFGGETIGSRPRVGPSIVDAPAPVFAWLVSCGLVGMALGRLLRLPSPFLLGPMLASGVVHLLGVTEFRPPNEIVAAAQLVLGVTLGCRFVGTPAARIGRVLVLSLGSTLILVAVALAFAAALSRLTGLPLAPLLLAYSPGGLTETSLVALALHIDVAFVATHHICRVVLVMSAAGPLFRLFEKRRLPRP